MAQFIKSPSGEEMVVLSKTKYEVMLEAMEDAADVAAHDAAKADAAGHCRRRAVPGALGAVEHRLLRQ